MLTLQGISFATAASGIFHEVLPWLVVLLGVIVAGTIVLSVLRRSLKPRESDDVDGFTLHGLRELHARGDLTDDEFARARAAVIERARGTTSENRAAQSAEPEPPRPDRASPGDNDDTARPESSDSL